MVEEKEMVDFTDFTCVHCRFLVCGHLQVQVFLRMIQKTYIHFILS